MNYIIIFDTCVPSLAPSRKVEIISFR